MKVCVCRTKRGKARAKKANGRCPKRTTLKCFSRRKHARRR